jgi:hypothetical protein
MPGFFHSVMPVHKKSSEEPYSRSSLLQSVTAGLLTYHQPLLACYVIVSTTTHNNIKNRVITESFDHTH